MKVLGAYAAVTALLVAGLAAAVRVLVAAADPAGVWLAAGLAWAVQLAAFAVLAAGWGGPRFVVGWGLGMALRFAVVGGTALVVTRSNGPDPATALVSLVGFVFVLVLLEPLFLRLAD